MLGVIAQIGVESARTLILEAVYGGFNEVPGALSRLLDQFRIGDSRTLMGNNG